MTYLKAVEAGADVIDTAMSPFSMGTSQPATEVMVETFKGTPYDTGLDQNLLAEIADYFRPMREEALKSRSDEYKGSRRKYQDTLISGTGWYVIKSCIPVKGCRCRRQVSGCA